jgi:putative ABC transport system ATP-binding protein
MGVPTTDTRIGDPAVLCHGIIKAYGGSATQVTALCGINLEVARGELLMLVGPSGCGKTTLISIIAGILNQDAGDCAVLGENLRNMGEAAKTAFRRHTIGFVFQSYNLIPQLDASENVMIPLLLNHVSRRKALIKAREALDRVGLADRWASPPAQLSGGQQQRVAIARALVHNPQLIVCDEPTSALDHATGHLVMDILRAVTDDDGRTLIVVTHDPRIFDFADRLAHMDDGRIKKVEQPHHRRTSRDA